MDDNACKEMLLEMGFPLQKIVQAMLSTNSKDIEELVTWMDQNEVFEEPPKEEPTNEEPNQKSHPPKDNNKIKVFKCKVCQKIFKNEDLAALHTSKTGHADYDENFEEFKPLTEEEKKHKLEELQQTMEKRRQEKLKLDEEEDKKKEIERRKQGKDHGSVKEKMREAEALKIVEERKREKMEEIHARQRVKELIEKDKIDRMKKFNYNNSDKEVLSQTVNNGDTGESSTKIAYPPPDQILEISKNYDKCVLQIRMTDGKLLKHTFGAQEELAAVRLYVLMNSPLLDFGASSDGQPTSQITLMTPFPKHVFSEEDMGRPLSELGLVPKAVLTVTKSKAQNF